MKTKTKSSLNEYHHKRIKENLKAVAEMMKRPKTSEEMHKQVLRNLYDKE